MILKKFHDFKMALENIPPFVFNQKIPATFSCPAMPMGFENFASEQTKALSDQITSDNNYNKHEQVCGWQLTNSCLIIMTVLIVQVCLMTYISYISASYIHVL